MSREVVTSLYSHKHLISLIMLDRQRQLLIRTDVRRGEIWEWSDHTPPECLAPDGAIEIIEALRPAAQERAQHDRRVLVESRTAHRRDRQDDVAIDDPPVEDLAH